MQNSKIQRIERLVNHFLKGFGIMANKQENIQAAWALFYAG